MNKLKLSVLSLSLLCLILSSCEKENDSAALIDLYDLAGEYEAQITPAFSGTTPITTGRYKIRLDKQTDGTLRLHYKGFREPPMPFEMTVDIRMTVKQGPGKTLLLEGKNGLFHAIPPDGKPIDLDSIPPGIILPPGSETGPRSEEASIEGVYANIEKENIKADRFELKLKPNIPMPVQILIYTHHKIK